jgi:hypothetical protein
MYILPFAVLSVTALAPLFALSASLPGLVYSPTPHYGPEVTIEHLFDVNCPTGVVVSNSGRTFINFVRPTNYTVVELIDGKEVPFPSAAMNTPPSLVNQSNPDVAVNYPDYLIDIQAIASEPSLFIFTIYCSNFCTVDAKDRLWALDTGRPTLNGKQLLNNGGGKLVAFDLSGNSTKPVQTIVFPLDVAGPNSFLNDVRFDLRPELTS